VNDSSFWQYIGKRFSDYCREAGVGWSKIDECAVFGHNVHIVVYCDNNPFWSSADTNKDDLE